MKYILRHVYINTMSKKHKRKQHSKHIDDNSSSIVLKQQLVTIPEDAVISDAEDNIDYCVECLKNDVYKQAFFGYNTRIVCNKHKEEGMSDLNIKTKEEDSDTTIVDKVIDNDVKDDKIHIKVVQRTAKKKTTCLENYISPNLNDILVDIKKRLSCGGNINSNSHLILNGDHRDFVKKYLIEKLNIDDNMIVIHGF